MENKENQAFQYTYSAKEQEELRRIREKYASEKSECEDKMERLRRLDRGVYGKAQAVSLTLGVIGTLIFGFGMSLVMSELATIIGIGSVTALVVGVIAGVIGGGVAALAYPAYSFMLEREREKIAPEIIRLTDELLK